MAHSSSYSESSIAKIIRTNGRGSVNGFSFSLQHTQPQQFTYSFSGYTKLHRDKLTTDGIDNSTENCNDNRFCNKINISHSYRDHITGGKDKVLHPTATNCCNQWNPGEAKRLYWSGLSRYDDISSYLLKSKSGAALACLQQSAE